MTRFELATSTLARWRSSQLSYIRVMGFAAPASEPFSAISNEKEL